MSKIASRVSAVLAFFLFITNVLIAQETAVLDWVKRIGGTSADRGRDMVLDASGNIYTTGHFTGTVDFDPSSGISNLNSAGVADIFISKMYPNGNLI